MTIDMLIFKRFTENKSADGHKMALFDCSCGREIERQYSRVINGYSTMCRECCNVAISVAKTQHGMRNAVEYRIWVGMKNRCLNPKSKDFHRYGGSGITVCKAWIDSFEAFFSHVGPRPSADKSIDRIDNSRGYEPGNVRWSTRREQQNNRRSTAFVTNGKRVVSISDLASDLNLTIGAVHMRLKRGKIAGYRRV